MNAQRRANEKPYSNEEEATLRFLEHLAIVLRGLGRRSYLLETDLSLIRKELRRRDSLKLPHQVK